jgi:antitoxin ParD1/3/4
MRKGIKGRASRGANCRIKQGKRGWPPLACLSLLRISSSFEINDITMPEETLGGSIPFKAFEPLTNFAKIAYGTFKWRLSMATMNVSLPDPMKDWVEAQARTGRYSNASDYVRDLIRRDQTRNDKIAAMQSFVEAGLQSGVGIRSKDDLFAEAMARASRS